MPRNVNAASRTQASTRGAITRTKQRDTYSAIINDTLADSNNVTGTLKNSATQQNGYIRLTEALNSQSGHVEYVTSGITPDGNFDCSFEFWTGGGTGADAVFLYVYTDGTPTNEDLWGLNGYSIAFDEYSNQIHISRNGLIYGIDPGFNIDSSTWHKARVIKRGNNFTVYVDGIRRLNVTIPPQTATNNIWGLGSRTGGLNNEHRVRNLKMLFDGSALVV